MLLLVGDDALLLPVLKPVVPGNPGVVFVDLAVAVLPLVVLGAVDADPAKPAAWSVPLTRMLASMNPDCPLWAGSEMRNVSFQPALEAALAKDEPLGAMLLAERWIAPIPAWAEVALVTLLSEKEAEAVG
jgi:hypothetical protein